MSSSIDLFKGESITFFIRLFSDGVEIDLTEDIYSVRLEVRHNSIRGEVVIPQEQIDFVYQDGLVLVELTSEQTNQFYTRGLGYWIVAEFTSTDGSEVVAATIQMMVYDKIQ